MDLLTDIDRAEIRLAIKDVTDTFGKTPVTYLTRTAKLSRFNEDGDNFTFSENDLYGFVEYQQIGNSKTDGTTFIAQGATDYTTIQVTFNTDDLVTAGLYDETNFISYFKPENDRMNINGVQYKVKDVSYDGAIERKNLLVIVKGERLMNK